MGNVAQWIWGKKQGWALKFLQDLGIWHKAHIFTNWTQMDFKS